MAAKAKLVKQRKFESVCGYGRIFDGVTVGIISIGLEGQLAAKLTYNKLKGPCYYCPQGSYVKHICPHTNNICT